MGIKRIFHKIIIGIVRRCRPSIPNTSEVKRYGNRGEDDFVFALKSLLPNCRVKKNVLVSVDGEKAEIDCLVLYDKKLFAIEVKRWKGHVLEDNGGFVQVKPNRYGSMQYIKRLGSPFAQLSRAISLLKRQIPYRAWINDVVFFDGAESVRTHSNKAWFTDMASLASYLRKSGKESDNARGFFDKCIAADCLFSDGYKSSLDCLVCDESLRFNIGGRTITRKDIAYIQIAHHWFYDDIQIKTVDERVYSTRREDAYAKVIENGRKKRYYFSKLRLIELGRG